MSAPFKIPAAVVGTYRVREDRIFLPMGTPELTRAIDPVDRVLRSFSFPRGTPVVLVALLEDSAFGVPLTQACVLRGLPVCNVDASEFDGARLESIVRRFQPAAVFGVNGDILKSLRGLGHDPVKLFAGIPVWARPDAYAELAPFAAQLKLHRWMEIGPAFALECGERNGVHYDAREWSIEAEGGELLVTSRMARATTFERQPTGVRGLVSRVVCRCGVPDPLVTITADAG